MKVSIQSIHISQKRRYGLSGRTFQLMKLRYPYGKNVFVTGASSGIGKACALLFAKNGYTVTGVSRSCPEGTKHFEGGGSLTLMKMDVTNSNSIQKVIRKLPQIDIAILAAGMGIAGSIEDVPIEQAKKQMDVNYFGVLRCCKAILPLMRRDEHGLILVIGSVAGRISIPMQSHYSSSKYALEALVDSLRLETAPYGIHAAIIEPGDTKTGFTDKRNTYHKENSPYNDAVDKAVGQMEKDERNGVSPLNIARIAICLSEKQDPKAKTAAGIKYKAAIKLVELLPDRCREAIVRKLYM